MSASAAALSASKTASSAAELSSTKSKGPSPRLTFVSVLSLLLPSLVVLCFAPLVAASSSLSSLEPSPALPAEPLSALLSLPLMALPVVELAPLVVPLDGHVCGPTLHEEY